MASAAGKQSAFHWGADRNKGCVAVASGCLKTCKRLFECKLSNSILYTIETPTTNLPQLRIYAASTNELQRNTYML